MESLESLVNQLNIEVEQKDCFELGLFTATNHIIEKIFFPFFEAILNNLKSTKNKNKDNYKRINALELKIDDLYNKFFDLYLPETESEEPKSTSLSFVQKLEFFFKEIELLQTELIILQSSCTFEYISLLQCNKTYKRILKEKNHKILKQNSNNNNQLNSTAFSISSNSDITPNEKMCISLMKSLSISAPYTKNRAKKTSVFELYSPLVKELSHNENNRKCNFLTKQEMYDSTNKKTLKTRYIKKTENIDLTDDSNSESEQEQQSIESLIVESHM
ncbi:hypothetical protein ACO0SA_004045 [Hanseniaspora valbyensis]